jgi:hypothetical protein
MKINPARVWQSAHDSTIAGSARLSVYYRVMLLSGQARDCRFVGSAAGNRKLSYECWVNFHILFLFTVNEHTVRRRPAGAQSRLWPVPSRTSEWYVTFKKFFFHIMY